jgi:hypothetical protein
LFIKPEQQCIVWTNPDIQFGNDVIDKSLGMKERKGANERNQSNMMPSSRSDWNKREQE